MQESENKIWNKFFRRTLREWQKLVLTTWTSAVWDLRLETGMFVERAWVIVAGYVKVRCWIRESCCWIRESSLLDTWEFVSGSEQIRWAEVSKIGERNWAESVSGTEQNRWAELMRERKWRVVIKREVDSYDVAWCRTWRGVRLNVAERAVERGGAAIFNLIHLNRNLILCRGHSRSWFLKLYWYERVVCGEREDRELFKRRIHEVVWKYR